MNNNTEVKKYIKNKYVLFFLLSTNLKEYFLSTLSDRIYDYLDDNPGAKMKDIENQFGTPWKYPKAIFLPWIRKSCLSESLQDNFCVVFLSLSQYLLS